ncbi:hypothetical protein HanRHA438_Chr13g0625631 [Helianthus annuus]|nr:hypothetical protein HanRHA438_Chr13g0625631 [Helianthus annuus]
MDIVNGVIDIGELGFLVKDMDAMVRKMERYVNVTARLYGEMEVLSELEVVWQKQDVRHLKDVSLWNMSYDKVVEMLARTVCTLYARICIVFDDTNKRREMFSNSSVSRVDLRSCRSLSQVSGQVDARSVKSSGGFRPEIRSKKGEMSLFKAEDFNFACGFGCGEVVYGVFEQKQYGFENG